MKRLICNLKMNLSLQEILDYKKKLEEIDSSNIIVCPAYCYIPLIHSKKFLVGAQDVYEEISGSYTGKVSVRMLKNLDVRNILLNHYELNDKKESVKKKIKLCVERKINVYIFISETIEEHYYQYTLDKLLKQIEYFIKDIDTKYYQYISFVYEPNWLIGKRTSLTNATIKNLFYRLKKEFSYKYNYVFGLYYGGGLTGKSLKELWNEDMIDGFVLGNYSLDVDNVINLDK